MRNLPATFSPAPSARLAPVTVDHVGRVEFLGTTIALTVSECHFGAFAQTSRSQPSVIAARTPWAR